MRQEVGGTPSESRKSYEARSPIAFADAIAASGVPLQIWWSTKDKIVTDQRTQSGTLFRVLGRLYPKARVTTYVGNWRHSTEMRATQLLPIALRELGLVPGCTKQLPKSVRVASTTDL